VGFLVAGFALNAIGAESGEALQEIANVGVTLLLFSIGCKLRVRSLLRPEVWAGASIHMLITVGVFGAGIYVVSLTGLCLFGELDLKLSLLIAFALLSAISALIIIGPRVYYAMAKDGYFFKGIAQVHPVNRVPSKAIMLQCLIAGVMVLSGTFDQILTYMGFCLGIFPILAVLGVFKLRDSTGASRSALYKVAAVFFAGVGIAILVLAYFERPIESSIGLATVGVGVPFYVSFARARRNAPVQ